jgi:hypothetical protein
MNCPAALQKLAGSSTSCGVKKNSESSIQNYKKKTYLILSYSILRSPVKKQRDLSQAAGN